MNAWRAKTRSTAARPATGLAGAHLATDVAAGHAGADLAADVAAALAGARLKPDVPAGLAADAWLRPLTSHWTAAAYAHLSLHAALVRITVLTLRGSAPREPGASMLVDANGTVGTIGGGQLEWHATSAARELLHDRDPAPVRILDLVLGPALGQCCGGRVELWLERLTRDDLPWLKVAARRATERRPSAGRGALGGRIAARPLAAGRGLELGLVTDVRAGFVSHRLRRSLPGAPALEIRRRVSAETSVRPAVTPAASIVPSSAPHAVPPLAAIRAAATLLEVLTPRRPHLWIFGAGHVGQALVRMLAELALFDITWIDSRDHLLAPGLPDCVTTRNAAAPATLVGSASPGTHYVVMTHDHGLDYDLCRAILCRGDAAWLGLIGSASKSARFRSRLLRDGVDRGRLSGLTCPIGVPGITSKLPAAIAIAIAAELLQRHTDASASATAAPVTTTASNTAASCVAPDAFAVASVPSAASATVVAPPTTAASASSSITAAVAAHTLACSGECRSCGAQRSDTQ